MSECLFCKIIKGEIPSDIVYQNDEVVAFKDIHPRAPIHILIVPKHHIGSVATLTEKDAKELPHLFLAAKVIADKLGVKDRGFRTVFNIGPDSGMIVDHLHLHLLAGKRLAGMG